MADRLSVEVQQLGESKLVQIRFEPVAEEVDVEVAEDETPEPGDYRGRSGYAGL